MNKMQFSLVTDIFLLVQYGIQQLDRRCKESSSLNKKIRVVRSGSEAKEVGVVWI